jgi:DNA-binding transcriptional MerR regulator
MTAGAAGLPWSRISTMRPRIAIGDFSRMTHLSVKALRHYHDLGVLEPAEVDPYSGYRFYQPGQVQIAQVIRRFRDLGMPLEDIRSVLDAPDVAVRNEVIVAHLERMESQLAQTQSTVASLRSLLERAPAPVAVQYRSVPAVTALAITQSVAVTEFEAWWVGAFRELFVALRAAGAAAAGPSGALYPSEFFERERGDVVAFVPVSGAAPGLLSAGRASIIEVPAAELAVAVHQGSLGDLDQAYGALGTYVTAREIGVEGPIREYYLVSPLETDDESRHLTEVCWPVFRTT